MTSIFSVPELAACLADLDGADLAVRALYRQLAENPDQAPEYDVALRELLAKRLELARSAGLATLAIWRASMSNDIGESASSRAERVEESKPEAAGQLTTPTASPALHASGTVAEDAMVDETQAVSLPAPPASDAQLAQWKEVVQSKGLGAALTPALVAQRPWGINLHEMMCLLGAPGVDLNDSIALLDELDALDDVATEERQLAWVRFPIETQKHWLSHLVARTRAIREHPASEGVIERLKKIRAVYPQWAREYVPGHVNGLQLRHAPVRGTWANDADEHWRALAAVVGHDLPAPRRSPPTRKKKERSVVEEESAIVEPDWPFLPIVRGKVAVIVGGAPKEPNRDRLETFLRLATLDWPLVDGPRKVEAVAQRIAKGTYDLVVVNQALISHPEAERILDAAKTSRTRWAIVEGYGPGAVKLGLERFLHGATTR
jgi:hypothetical protein